MSNIQTQLIDARGKQKQKEVATTIVISPKHLSKLERGERTPSLVTASLENCRVLWKAA